MRYSAKIICVFLFFISFNLNAMNHDIRPGMHVFSKTLRLLSGQSSNCESALSDTTLHIRVSYFLMPQRQEGSGYASIENPTSSRPPIQTDLSQDGDSDRYGFTHYYYPPEHLVINHNAFGLRGIIFNICMNGEKQAGVMLDLPSGEECVMTTRVWNYCR